VPTQKSRRIQQSRVEPIEDLNLRAAALLYDMAALQPTERSQFGYKRAARAIVALPMSVVDAVSAGSLRDIQFVGPSSARIVTELVETGRSQTVEDALARSPKGSRVTESRRTREHFLSAFAMQQALDGRAARGVISRGDFRGDFQMHTTWSDGAETVATMADACMRLGHTCMGVTDHSYGLPVARGMAMESVAAQHREIDALNARLAGRFRIFKGIEANVLADGSLDLQPEERRQFEFVIASAHSLLRRPDDQTARMLGAVRAEGVAILGHPRGRMFNTRVGVVADWDRVFAAAAERRVAIELDGHWHRQDVDYVLARRALDAGCLFALDSDAHAIGELAFTDYSIAHARLARIPAAQVINCWSDGELAAWMSERRLGR
jgi:histidinol phosphatase-like PHP family hydrolase